MMGGDNMISMFAFLPIIFWIIIIVLIILFIVRLTANKSGHSNESSLYQKLADSEQLQQESLRRQQELADELKEVNERLARMEKLLENQR